jgi:hypothetical protein
LSCRLTAQRTRYRFVFSAYPAPCQSAVQKMRYIGNTPKLPKFGRIGSKT